ncbi:MAG: DUF3857 domain-containing protein [Planctomycetota bacterium]
MSYGRFAVFLAFVLMLIGPAAPAWADGRPAPLGADEIKALIGKAGDAAKHNADSVVVFHATDVFVRPNGIGSARNQVVTKVLRDPAIRSLAVQRFEFDPHTNRLDLMAVRVYRANGDVEEIPVTARIQQPQPASGIFWGTQQYLVTLPRLAVGDAVETIAEMTGFNVAYLTAAAAGPAPGKLQSQARALAADAPKAAQPPADAELNALGEVLEPPVAGHWHDEVHFFSSVPILHRRYTVRVPKDKPLQTEVYNGELRSAVLLEGDQLVYTFEKKDITPFQNEPAMESTPNVGTKVLLATLPTWQDKARWLHGVSEPQLEADDAIRAKVAEIIENCRTDEEKWTALNHWVAENIRYSGTSRGMCEGYTIHKSTETFRDRCGVCKDKAGMLCTMLRVAGFDSYTVMTMARQRVDRVPADQFNHCVTCIRHKDGSLLLLDPTWMPKSRDNWSTLEPLQHVVYGIPEGKELSLSPYFPPEQCAATWTADTQIGADGAARTKIKFTACGTPEGRLRRSLAGYHPADRVRAFQETVQRVAPNAELVRHECMDPVDFSGPVVASLELAADGYALGNGGRRYLALPLMQTPLGDRTLADLIDKTGPKERKYGLKLSATRLAKIEETIKLPAGWDVTRKPDPVELDGPAAGLKFKLATEPGQIHYTCELTIKQWQIPPEHYANFKEVMDKFQELTGRVITCTAGKAEGEDAN